MLAYLCIPFILIALVACIWITIRPPSDDQASATSTSDDQELLSEFKDQGIQISRDPADGKWILQTSLTPLKFGSLAEIKEFLNTGEINHE